VILLKGFKHITLPYNNFTSAYITGNKLNIIFITNTADVSYNSYINIYLSSTKNKTVPEHNKLYIGPYIAEDIAGLRIG
ncbi:hypothetical protein QBC46DRAFT_217958, partial [Diplogelasinospora grovesii]